MTALASFNRLPSAAAEAALQAVCSSPVWAAAVAGARPYGSIADACAAADSALASLPESEIDRALAGHPRIGERSRRAASAREQAAVLAAGPATLAALADANAAYERRFGHVYLVAAAGRGPDELLAVLHARLDNPPDVERRVLRGELAAINRLRLRGMLETTEPEVPMTDTTLSTHVLDTTTGRPARGVPVALTEAGGAEIASALTDDDGRVSDLATVGPGRYTLTFATGAYFPDALYPEVSIVFDAPGAHLHLPLLLSPFAYSTYRGS